MNSDSLYVPKIRRLIAAAAVFTVLFLWRRFAVLPLMPARDAGCARLRQRRPADRQACKFGRGQGHLSQRYGRHVTVDWAKIKEIRTPQKFAVIEKGVKPSKKTPEAWCERDSHYCRSDCAGASRLRATPAPIPVKDIDS